MLLTDPSSVGNSWETEVCIRTSEMSIRMTWREYNLWFIVCCTGLDLRNLRRPLVVDVQLLLVLLDDVVETLLLSHKDTVFLREMTTFWYITPSDFPSLDIGSMRSSTDCSRSALAWSWSGCCIVLWYTSIWQAIMLRCLLLLYGFKSRVSVFCRGVDNKGEGLCDVVVSSEYNYGLGL
jgi:hypothetical protein